VQIVLGLKRDRRRTLLNTERCPTSMKVGSGVGSGNVSTVLLALYAAEAAREADFRRANEIASALASARVRVVNDFHQLLLVDYCRYRWHQVPVALRLAMEMLHWSCRLRPLLQSLAPCDTLYTLVVATRL